MFIFCLGGVCGLGFCIQLSLASAHIRLYPYRIAEIVPKIVCQEGLFVAEFGGLARAPVIDMIRN